jgi:hypothetical protein
MEKSHVNGLFDIGNQIVMTDAYSFGKTTVPQISFAFSPLSFVKPQGLIERQKSLKRRIQFLE